MDEETWTGKEQILSFGEGERPYILKSVFEHILVSGRTGSGKSSGALGALIKGLLAQGVGMLFLCVKADAHEDITQWAKAVGREQDLVYFGRDESYRFNPLAFEASTGERGQTMSLVEFLDNMISIASPQQNSGGEAFWRNARGELLKSAIDVIRFSKREVTLEAIQILVKAAPQNVEEMSKAYWKADFCANVLAEAKANVSGTVDERDFQMCERYFTGTFPNMSDKTRGTVVSDLTSMLDNLLRGLPGRLFSSDTNIDPTDLERGKIIVVDFPILKHGLAGRLINGGWKYCVQQYFQRIAERRRNDPTARPVIVAVDEVQLCLLSSDSLALTTLRSTKVGVIMATQNFSNIHVALGRGSEHEVDSILGNVGTFFFGSNLASDTYKWIAAVVGDKRETLTTTGRTNSYKNPLDLVPSLSDSHSLSETFRPHLIQEDFIRLKNGGEEHGYIVESIVVQAGREWKNGALFKKVGFDQRA